MTKPLSLEEVVARLRGLLRRAAVAMFDWPPKSSSVPGETRFTVDLPAGPANGDHAPADPGVGLSSRP